MLILSYVSVFVPLHSPSRSFSPRACWPGSSFSHPQQRVVPIFPLLIPLQPLLHYACPTNYSSVEFLNSHNYIHHTIPSFLIHIHTHHRTPSSFPSFQKQTHTHIQHRDPNTRRKIVNIRAFELSAAKLPYLVL